MIEEFFAPAPFEERVFPMRQEFDYVGLEGSPTVVLLRPPIGMIPITRRCCES